ncbi:MAG: universal stress protein [Nitrospirales bacterium]|nr:universal stress protein [Nitrospirales bacterium]
MGRIGKKFETLMAAVSFAEEGEFRTAGEIVKERRGVLIALKGDETDSQAIRYGVSTCKRVDAELHILVLSAGESEPSFHCRFLPEIEREGIRYRVVTGDGCLKKEIVDYTNREKGVLFVVIGSEEGLDRDCRGKERKISDAWQRLRCPLVVVTGAAQA